MVERGGRERDRAGWVKCLLPTGSNPDTSGSLPVGFSRRGQTAPQPTHGAAAMGTQFSSARGGSPVFGVRSAPGRSAPGGTRSSNKFQTGTPRIDRR